MIWICQSSFDLSVIPFEDLDEGSSLILANKAYWVGLVAV